MASEAEIGKDFKFVVREFNLEIRNLCAVSHGPNFHLLPFQQASA